MAHESLIHLDEFLQYPRLEQKQVENWNFNREIIEIIYKIALLKNVSRNLMYDCPTITRDARGRNLMELKFYFRTS